MFRVIASAVVVGSRQLVGWRGGVRTRCAPWGGTRRNGPLWVSIIVTAVAIVVRRGFLATILILIRLLSPLPAVLAVAPASTRSISVSVSTVAIAVALVAAGGTRFIRSR